MTALSRPPARTFSFAWLIAAALAFSINPSATAWNANGHMKVALVAHDVLIDLDKKEVFDAVVDILKQHEKFEEDFLGKMPNEIKSATQATQDQWIFAHAAVFPDIARRYSGHDRKKFHQGTWHYVNFPVVLERSKAFFADGYPINMQTEWNADTPTADMNVIQALLMSDAFLRRPAASKTEKATYMAWLFHLVGDAHQPLHGSAMFSKTIFPKGDRGGNDTKIVDKGNLHYLWDKGMGTSTWLPTISGDITTLLEDEDARDLGESAAEILDPVRWIEESNALAREFVYTPEIVEEIAAQENRASENAATGNDDVALTPMTLKRFDDYQATIREVSEQRLIQAGYRLAHALISLELVLDDTP